MARSHYVIRKVGDHFVPEMQQDPSHVMMYAAGGTALGLYGLLRGGLIGKLMLLGGGLMAYHGLTGRNPLARLMSNVCHVPTGRSEETPSFQNDFKAHTNQMPADDVDEAAMESFPASDPPARRIETTA